MRDGGAAAPGSLYSLAPAASERWAEALMAYGGRKDGQLAILDVWSGLPPTELAQALQQAGHRPQDWLLLRASGPIQAEAMGCVWLRQAGPGAHLVVLAAEDVLLRVGAKHRFAAPDWLRLARRQQACIWGVPGALDSAWRQEDSSFAAWSIAIGN